MTWADVRESEEVESREWEVNHRRALRQWMLNHFAEASDTATPQVPNVSLASVDQMMRTMAKEQGAGGERETGKSERVDAPVRHEPNHASVNQDDGGDASQDEWDGGGQE